MDWIGQFLALQKEKHLLRELTPIEKRKDGKIIIKGKEFLDFCSNDYLGLSTHPSLLEEAKKMQELYGTSSSASRLLSGDLELHHLLEQEIAKFKNKESALIFGSGYLANIGVIPAVCGKEDVIFSDYLNHASIIDGILISRSKFFRFKHNDVNHIEDLLKKERHKYRRALILIETVYSMEGDIAPLKEIVELSKKYDTLLMVDEAHATGIFGKNGEGIVEREKLTSEVDIIMGTFGKALGSYGAYVVGSCKMINYLVNKARSFIYSTALPPSIIGANIRALKIIKKEPFRRRKLLENAKIFRNLLDKRKFNIKGTSQIVPLIIGENKKTIELSMELQKNRIYALPIRPPTVPPQESRIRFSITYHHSKKELTKVATLLNNYL